MPLQASFQKRVFHFAFDARTSRGAMKEKTSWFITIRNSEKPDIAGIGECGPLPGLSIDHKPELPEIIEKMIQKFNENAHKITPTFEIAVLNQDIITSLGEEINQYPSLLFAFETALLDLFHGGKKLIFKNGFCEGSPIPINGLIWMGGLDFMLQQIELKIRDGFRCLKLKVGGINFEKECDILHYIRRKYFREDITIRLDANGAFRPADALYKLKELAKFGIHSIEQPIKPGSPEMPELCADSPIPIALDEELIGVYGSEKKRDLLTRIKPQFIILKPTLHGGFFGSQEWIELAENQNIAWWITSALESNVGLNAIAQFTAQYHIEMPQGLGTGMLYTDNIESPLTINQGFLSYNLQAEWGNIN
jgi:o-succinylbenzoate synthase